MNDIQKYAKNILGSMDIEAAIDGFQKLGVEADDLSEILLKSGFSVKEVKDGLEKLGKSGLKSTKNLKDVFTGLLVIMKSIIPVASMVIVAFAGFKLFDSLFHTIDRMDESLGTLKDEINAVTEELTSLESESSKTEARLEELYELKEKGSLTFAEEEELRLLEAQNRELQRKIDLLKAEQALKQSEANKTFIDIMNGDLNSAHITRGNKIGYDVKIQDGMEVLTPIYDTEINYINSQFEKYKQNLDQIAKEEESYKDQIAEAQKAGDMARVAELLDSQKSSTKKYEEENKKILSYLDEKKAVFEKRSSGLSYYTGDDLTEEQQEFNRQLSYIEDFVDRRAILLGYDGAKTGAIYRLMDTEFADVTDSLKTLGEHGDVTAEILRSDKYDEFIQKLIDIGAISDRSDDSLNFVAKAFNNVDEYAQSATGSLEEVTSGYQEMTGAVSDLKSELNAINGAISEQGYSGNLSVDTYNSLIAIEKDYADCIEYQNGALQLNAEKANLLFEAKSELKKAEIELQKITEATTWKENADEIARLTKNYENLSDAERDHLESLKKKNSEIEANLVGYDLQITAIEELTSAYGRWKAVSESDNSDSMYKDIQKAYEQIEASMKSGQTGVGNVVYQAAVELLVPDGQEVSKYMSTLKRYIMDGSSGLNNFINDMITNGLMDRAGSEVNMRMGVTMAQICETMKITPDMAKAIFNALEMYDFDFHWTDEDFNINTASVEEMQAELKRLQAEADATKAKIAELNEAGSAVDVSTGLSIEDYKKQLDAQVAAYDEVAKKLGTDTYDQAANKIEYTITVNTEDADTALDKIKSKLEEILDKVKDIFKKELGDLGGGDTLSILKNVLNTLRNINAYKIADKTFTVTQYTTTTGTKPYGSISSHDQNIKNDTSAHAAVASGTRHADAGIALVGDEYSPDGSPRPELIITDGAAYIAGQNGPEFVNLKDGDQVVPASETEKIIQRNPDVKRSVVPAFATGAGGYPAGSVQEDKYLEGVIGPDPTWLKQREEQKKKDDELIKQLSAKAAEKSADDTYLNNNAALNTNSTTKTYLNTNVTVGGGGNSSSLENPGSGSGGGSGSGSSGSSDSSSSSNEKSQFEKDYEYHQHLLAMEKESYEDYIKWLESSYEDAYNQGQIELEEFYRYEEEVFNGQKELFQDSITDIEHKIKSLERTPGNEKQIINYYNQIISSIDKEIAAARARGLNDDDDYIQELLEQKWDYADEIKDIQDEISENAKDAVEDLIEYRMDMLKQDLENEKDAVNDKLDTLKDFYDKQKEMLQDVYDEEKYLEEQSEKRKSVDDIKAEIDMLKFDDSAKAQKRIKELQEELKAAEKDLTDFEKDHALENATDLLDKMYEKQESQMQSEIDAIDAKLNDPNALYNQALRDIQNNTLALYEEMVAYNNKYGSGNPGEIFDMWSEADKALDAYFKTMGESYKNILLVDAYKPTGYASGTSYATPGMHELFEGNKDEYVYTTKDGKRYRMFSGLGDKVLNASATDFLYRFANNGEAFISSMMGNLVGAIGNVGKPAQQIQLSTGDVIVQGNASNETVSAIRRAQRDNIDFVLREFTRLNR